MLAGTGRCWTGVCILGLTLDELADLARANTSRKVTILRDLNEEQFWGHLCCSNDPGRRYIVTSAASEYLGAALNISLNRRSSPADDLVFILDVNQDYQPWLVQRTRLFAAVNTFDGGKKRGLLLIE